MKKNFVLMLMLCFSMFSTLELKAQGTMDAFFINDTEVREDQHSDGLYFNDFIGNENVPNCFLGNGMLVMAATGALYLVNKRKKENK